MHRICTDFVLKFSIVRFVSSHHGHICSQKNGGMYLLFLQVITTALLRCEPKSIPVDIAFRMSP